MNRFLLFCVACLLLAAAPHGPASAGWTVTNLHPAGARYSWAYDVSGGQQVGHAGVGGTIHASLWSGTAESWVDLHPAGTSYSAAYGISGGQQVGNAHWGSWGHASLWSGTAASWVDLNPAGALYSSAKGVSGGQQVGYAYVGYNHASLWSGTAESWVDLNPTGAGWSYAYGVSGGQQVGFAEVGGVAHASLWSGTAESWVDLNPAGASLSDAYGVSGGQQVGSADGHASLWSGTAESWVDLHPAGAVASQAWGVSGGRQVGQANVGGEDHASLWSGTAESWVDLHALLPAGYHDSEARGLFTSGVDTWVAGFAYNTSLDREEAFLWHSQGPITSDVVATPNPMEVGTQVILSAIVDDFATGGSAVVSADYSLDGGTNWVPMGGTFGGVFADVTASFPAPITPGMYDLCVSGTDEYDNVGPEACIYFVVYDPEGGFVTGGGWIYSPAGACVLDPEAEGKANFGFVCKYKKGANVPTGQTEFQFKAADLNFHSTSYQWLVVAGPKAQFEGSGTINGTGNYGFMLTATDGQLAHDGVHKFRIKIWDKDTDAVVYDNGNDTPLGGGSIAIHMK